MNKPEPVKKSQVQIGVKNLNADRSAVEKILLTAALKYNLYDNTHTSRVPNTIKSIVEQKGHGFGLGARVVKNFIYVDFNRREKVPGKFDEVHTFILNELRSSFHCDSLEIFEDSPSYFKTC